MNRDSGRGKDLYLHTGGDSRANILKISFVCDRTEGFLFKYTVPAKKNDPLSKIFSFELTFFDTLYF